MAQPRQDEQARGGIDWLFVIDTSASMRGVGGTQNIFDLVKAAVGEFITGASLGDSVTIYTFDRDTRVRPTVRIADETDRRDLRETIKGLEANGARTHTGKAISDALRRAGELGARADAADRKVGIVLLTDGLEDVLGIPNAVSIPSTVSLIPDNRPYMFFVSLGAEKETAIEEAFRGNPDLGGFQTLDQPSKEALARLDEAIRPLLERAARKPTRIEIAVTPATLDFGEVEPGRRTSRQEITVSSTEDIQLLVALTDPADVALDDVHSPLDLRANEQTTIPFGLAVAPEAPDGPRSLMLKLEPVNPPPDAVITPASLALELTIYREPAWRKALKWTALLLLPLLLLVAGYSIVKGQPPWVMWQRWRERAHLEGELEVLRPRPAQHDAHVSLADLQRERVPLASLLPAGAVLDDDAELFTIYKDKVKQVRIQRTRGVVRVNGVEVSTANLYDGHLIELGDAKMRFHWLNHDEPVADLQDE